MKENRATNLRALSAQELEGKIRQLREELFNLRFRNSVKQVDNPLRLRGARRDIARIETILREHQKGIHPLASAGADN